jgi:dihydrofolate synthase/folylpolyglutamate synthase
MKDKDIAAMMTRLGPLVDVWHFTDLPTPRAASAAELEAMCQQAFGSRATATHQHASPSSALAAALEGADPADRIVVFGSFYTVGGVLEHGLPRRPGRHLG